MTIEAVARIIQIIIVPAVMITTCAILLGALMAHYAAVNDRIRAMALERLGLLRAAPDAIGDERLAQIDGQLPELIRRHRTVQDAILCTYGAVLLFLLDMFAIAFAAWSALAWAAGSALVLFLGGIAALLAGVALTIAELRASHRAVVYEARRVLALKR